MANTNFRVALTNTDPSAIESSVNTASGCILTIESRTVNGFTFSCRLASDGSATTLDRSHTFDYIAIPNN